MSDIRRAGWEHAGRFCRACDHEITADDEVRVDVDADMTEDGYRDLTTVAHFPACPPEEE